MPEANFPLDPPSTIWINPDGTPTISFWEMMRKIHQRTGGDLGAGPLEYKNLFYLEDRKPSGTPGGTFTSGAWRTRVLASIVNNIPGASVAANVITLPSGTYLVEGSAPAYVTQRHVLRFQNTSDASTAINGTAEYAGIPGSQSRSMINGVVTITLPKTFEVQHRCQTTGLTIGFGVESSLGEEIYTTLNIWKVA